MMTENELREMLGDELFNGLSKDDKELILNTAGKFDFNIEGEIPNKPFCPQPFYVIDKELRKLVLHPTMNEGIEVLAISRPERAYFAIDTYGSLLLLDDCGNWIYAPERYIYVFNSDYWS